MNKQPDASRSASSALTPAPASASESLATLALQFVLGQAGAEFAPKLRTHRSIQIPPSVVAPHAGHAGPLAIEDKDDAEDDLDAIILEGKKVLANNKKKGKKKGKDKDTKGEADADEGDNDEGEESEGGSGDVEIDDGDDDDDAKDDPKPMKKKPAGIGKKPAAKHGDSIKKVPASAPFIQIKFNYLFDKEKAAKTTRGSFTTVAYKTIKAVDPDAAKAAYARAAAVWDSLPKKIRNGLTPMKKKTKKGK